MGSPISLTIESMALKQREKINEIKLLAVDAYGMLVRILLQKSIMQKPDASKKSLLREGSFLFTLFLSKGFSRSIFQIGKIQAPKMDIKIGRTPVTVFVN